MGRQYGYLLSSDIAAVYNLVAPYQDKYNIACGKVNTEVIEDFYQSYPPQFEEDLKITSTSGMFLA